MRLIRCVLSICIPLLMTACDKKEKLPGKREAIPGIVGTYNLEPASPSERSFVISAPTAMSLNRFTSTCGNDRRLALNHKMSQNPKQLWKASIGSGPISTDPIAFGGHIYSVDANGKLVCISQKDGKIIWKKNVADQPDDGLFSGGLTANEDVIYIGTNIGTVVAIDSKTQKKIWEKKLKFPIKGAPLYVSGKIIVTTINNQTMALNSRNGEVIWTKTVNQEQAMMCEASTPAVIGDSIICAYSSGDIMSLKLADGSDNWADVLFPGNIAESGSVISHITAAPVVWNDFVLISMAEGRVVLIDVGTGIRFWDQEIGTISTPAVVNGWAFILLNNGTIICISLKTGHVKWTADLGALCVDNNNHKHFESKWSGPLIVNGDVVVVNDAGYILSLDISFGKLKKRQFFKNVRMTRIPIVVDGKLLAITAQAELHALG